jgi:hypothetical protein
VTVYLERICAIIGLSLRKEARMSILSILHKPQKAAGERSFEPSRPKAERVETAFAEIPKNLKELKELSDASLTDPFKTAAYTVCAFCVYATDPVNGLEMVNYLKGPQELSVYDRQLIKDKLEGKKYIPFSYFKGAIPENEYIPSRPYVVEVQTNAFSYSDEGYIKMYVQSGGADSLRSITLRRKGEQWFLWEQMILADIRKPRSADPWA